MFGLSYKNLLWIILASAFIVRLLGINYGLPLWLVGDEPPFIAATLKMIELKTILPVLHQEEFKATMYFPPYLSYLYLVPFSMLLGLKYLFFSGTMLQFKNFIVSDLSQFFILARIISAVFGTLTVWLVYKISKNIFKKEIPALLGAIFLTFSLLHIHLSSVARDWVPSVFLFALGIYFLSRADMAFKKRYILAALTAGIAFGVSLISGFLMLFILFWYLFYERNTFASIFKNKTLYLIFFIFLALAILSITTYPYGYSFLFKDNSVHAAKSILGFMISAIKFFIPLLKSEPVLIVFGFLGLVFSFKNARNYFWTAVSFLISYTGIYYLIFHYEQRYTIYLFPVIAILAGYGFYMSYRSIPNKILKKILLLTLLIPLAGALRLDWLLIKNDSRVQARQWAESNLPQETKTMVYSEMTRFASNKDAIAEQQSLDPASLRQIDYAEMNFEKNQHGYTNFHVLNLYSVNNENFYENIPDYAKNNNYKYLFIDPIFPPLHPEKIQQFDPLVKNSVLIRSFGSSQKKYCIRDGNFGSIFGLFKLEDLGPKINVYDLKYGNNE